VNNVSVSQTVKEWLISVTGKQTDGQTDGQHDRMTLHACAKNRIHLEVMAHFLSENYEALWLSFDLLTLQEV